MCVVACRLELKWSQDKSIRKVLWMHCQTWGGALEKEQIFILAEGLKIKLFLAISGRESTLVQTSVNLVYT